MDYASLNESLGGQAEPLIRELKPFLAVPASKWWESLSSADKTRWAGILRAKAKPAKAAEPAQPPA